MTRLLLLGWFASSPAHAWEHIGLAWEDADLPVSYVTNDDGVEDCAGLPGGQCALEAQAAFDAWDDAGCTSFGGNDAGFLAAGDPSSANLGDGFTQISFDAEDVEPGVLASTSYVTSGVTFSINGETYFALSEADIAVGSGPFVSHDDAVAGNCTDAYDLRGVLAHEIGHLAGLANSCDEDEPCSDPLLRNATMYWQAAACDPEIATPNEDDIEGMEALYGPRATLECGTSGSESILGIAPLTLNCVVGADGPLDDATWTFGDGTTDTGTGVTHTWDTEGTYTVAVNATGTSPSCGPFEASLERKGYVRVCEKPQAEFTVSHLIGVKYALHNQTQINVVGCATEVKWALYKGSQVKGEPYATFENWEFNYEFPEEGEWTFVLNVGGPAGTSAAKVTVDAYKHAGIHPFGCQGPTEGSALLLFFPLIWMRRRRLAA